MLEATADEFIPLEHRLRHFPAGVAAQPFQRRVFVARLFQTGIKVLAFNFQLSLERTPAFIHIPQAALLEVDFLLNDHTILFTAAALALHVVHFTHHGLVFTVVFHLHKLALALLDAGGFTFELLLNALLLLPEVLELVQNMVALFFLFGKTAGQLFHFFRGRLQFLLNGINVVIHMLQGNQFADSFDVCIHDDTSVGSEVRVRDAKGSRPGMKLTRRPSVRS